MNSDLNKYQFELVKRTCKGDMSAFHEIVEIYKKKVYYISFNICGDHHEAEDISQEVFIKVFRFIKKFRFDAKLSSWIYQISVNTSLDIIRKRKNKQIYMETSEMESLPSDLSESNVNNNDPENLAIQDSIQQKILETLKDLSKKEHAAFILRYYNGFKYVEIAEILDISINSIKTLLLRAKRKLKKKLNPYKHEYIIGTQKEVSYE